MEEQIGTVVAKQALIQLWADGLTSSDNLIVDFTSFYGSRVNGLPFRVIN